MMDLDALERLLAAATPGRWSHRSKLEDGTPCCDVIGDSDDDWSIVATGNPDLFDMREANAALIAAAVNALPELIAAARERDGLRARMESNENAWNAEQGELLDLVADRTIDLAGAKTAARFIAAERDALRAEVERMRAVVEAARACRCWHGHGCTLLALDAAKEGER